MKLPLAFPLDLGSDLPDIALWYEGQKAGLSEQLYLRLEDTFNAIAERPTSFPIAHKDIRRGLVKQFSCAVYFRILPDHVLVLAVVHTSQTPGAWRRRT